MEIDPYYNDFEKNDESVINLDDSNLSLIVKLTKLKNMNVFIYEGPDRDNAKTNINENMQLVVGNNYTVSYKSGMLMVAYPEKDVETELEFEYHEADFIYVNYTLILEIEMRVF